MSTEQEPTRSIRLAMRVHVPGCAKRMVAKLHFWPADKADSLVLYRYRLRHSGKNHTGSYVFGYMEELKGELYMAACIINRELRIKTEA